MSNLRGGSPKTVSYYTCKFTNIAHFSESQEVSLYFMIDLLLAIIAHIATLATQQKRENVCTASYRCAVAYLSSSVPSCPPYTSESPYTFSPLSICELFQCNHVTTTVIEVAYRCPSTAKCAKNNS